MHPELQFALAALDKRAAEDLWKSANKAKSNVQRFERNRIFFKYAPFAQQVYAPTRRQAHQAATLLSQKYGTPDQDGQYPRLPDGSRMRFLAASVYLDMQGRATAASLFKKQVIFAQTEIVAPIPIRNPRQTFPKYGGKTMQQIILDLKDPEMGEEPYFRHIRKKYHWNYKCCQYEVSIHGQMYQKSANVLRELKKILTEEYDQEVGDALMEGAQEDGTDQMSTGGGMSGISIATDDRYINGPARFIIEGLDQVKKHKGPSLNALRKPDSDENTMNIRSTTSGLTGNTGLTVPEGPDTFADTRSYATPDDASHVPTVSETVEDTEGNKSVNNSNNLAQSSKRNSSNGAWIVHGSAKSVADLARKVAASVIPRGTSGGEDP